MEQATYHQHHGDAILDVQAHNADGTVNLGRNGETFAAGVEIGSKPGQATLLTVSEPVVEPTADTAKAKPAKAAK